MSALVWSLAAVAVVVGIATFAVPWVIAEVFPWRLLREQFHGRPTLRTKSYEGRTVMVTGANGAFGSRASKLFARGNAETLVLVDARDCSAVKAEILAELADRAQKPNILVWQLDMMSYDGCRELAKRAQSLKSLDHVLMTMGILAFDCRQSPEGWETSIQVNYLSNALIGLLLLPMLKSAPSNPSPPVLTFITSFGIYPSSPTMSVPKSGSYLRKLNSEKNGMMQPHQYGRSKGLLLYFARELAERITALQKNGGKLRVTINSADPGTAWTPLTAPNQKQLIPRLITNFGARDPLICATALTNGVSAGADGHGKIMLDFRTGDYPPFMLRKSGQLAQKRVWEETRAEFEAKVPEVKAVYSMLDGSFA